MTKKSVLLAMLGVLCATSAHAQPRGFNGCYMYEKDDFRGAQFTMDANTTIEDLGARRGWNDEVSSAWVTPNCSLTLFKHSSFRGQGVVVTQSLYNFRNIKGSLNDEISSAQCVCS